MIISALLFILGIVTLMRVKSDDFISAGLFTIFILLRDYHLVGFFGESYFILSSLIDLMIIIVLYNLSNISALTKNLSFICFLSVVINTIGWIFWENYVNHIYYDQAFIVLFGYMIIIMLRTDRNVGHNTNNSHWLRFFSNHTQCVQYIFKNKGSI